MTATDFQDPNRPRMFDDTGKVYPGISPLDALRWIADHAELFHRSSLGTRGAALRECAQMARAAILKAAEGGFDTTLADLIERNARLSAALRQIADSTLMPLASEAARSEQRRSIAELSLASMEQRAPC